MSERTYQDKTLGLVLYAIWYQGAVFVKNVLVQTFYCHCLCSSG